MVVALAASLALGCTLLTTLDGFTSPDVAYGVEGGTVKDSAIEADAAVFVPDGSVIVEAGADVAVEAGRGINCGDLTCPLSAESVCCFDRLTGAHSCTTRALCTQAWLACDDTKDCAALGLGAFTCCADSTQDDAGMYYTTVAQCRTPSACDATGPQDQLCDPMDSSECTQAGDGRTSCKPYTSAAVAIYGYCTTP